jgi:putative oxidoreductase
MSTRTTRLPPWTWFAVRLAAGVLGAVFLWAGLAKAQDVAGFFRDLQSFRLFPAPLAAALAYYIPALELVAGVAVLLRRWRRAGALVLGAMAVAYFLVLALSWARGLDISCGCFGGGPERVDFPWLLLRDALLLPLAVVVYIGGAEKPAPRSSRP